MAGSSGARPLRVLTFTTLYPNAARPNYAVFVETRLRNLVASGEATALVLAPVPYFPFRGEGFGAYAAFAKVPRQETRSGIQVDHPSYLVIPKIGMSLAPFLLYAAARRALRRLLRDGHNFDVIDAHYFYPDGVAAVMLGREFGLPVTVTARGSDINLLPDYAVPRRLIRWAAKRADGLITVSSALADRLAELGVERERITVLRNGVDPAVFRPVDPLEETPARPLLLSVGNLVPLKRHDLAIRALAELSGELPEARLWIVGGGPERTRLEALANSLGVAGRVRFLGVVPHDRMPAVYSAADVLILASEREGWPNVLLEAMACGTRVVTTDVSDVAALVSTPAAGAWTREHSLPALVNILRDVLATPVPREATRAHSLRFSWEETTRGQLALFREVLHQRGADVP